MNGKNLSAILVIRAEEGDAVKHYDEAAAAANPGVRVYEVSGDRHASVCCVEVAPGAVPLLSASWERIDRKSEERLMVDRHLRGHGYVYGGADLWRWRILLHVSALSSFRAGFCLSGKVTISSYAPASFGSDAAWSKSNADGYVDGHVIGVSGGKWLDDTRTIWSTNLIMAREVAT